MPPRHARQPPTAIVPPNGMFVNDRRRSSSYAPSPVGSSSSSGVHTQRNMPYSTQDEQATRCTREEREFERMRTERRGELEDDLEAELDDRAEPRGYAQRRTPQPYDTFPDDYYDELAHGQVSSPEPMHVRCRVRSTTLAAGRGQRVVDDVGRESLRQTARHRANAALGQAHALHGRERAAEQEQGSRHLGLLYAGLL